MQAGVVSNLPVTAAFIFTNLHMAAHERRAADLYISHYPELLRGHAGTVLPAVLFPVLAEYVCYLQSGSVHQAFPPGRSGKRSRGLCVLCIF